MTEVFQNLKIFKTEVVRKSIHILIAFCPLMAAWNRTFTILILMTGILAYIQFEKMRIKGLYIPFISSITALAARPRDVGRFIMGPITLGLGALLVLIFFPLQIASIAIYALAFGDGFASLIGKIFGRIRPAFMFGKSVEGSLACFFAVFAVSWNVSHNLAVSLTAAFTATIVEAMPLDDFDNILVPLTTAFFLLVLR